MVVNVVDSIMPSSLTKPEKNCESKRRGKEVKIDR